MVERELAGGRPAQRVGEGERDGRPGRDRERATGRDDEVRRRQLVDGRCRVDEPDERGPGGGQAQRRAVAVRVAPRGAPQLGQPVAQADPVHRHRRPGQDAPDGVLVERLGDEAGLGHDGRPARPCRPARRCRSAASARPRPARPRRGRSTTVSTRRPMIPASVARGPDDPGDRVVRPGPQPVEEGHERVVERDLRAGSGGEAAGRARDVRVCSASGTAAAVRPSRGRRSGRRVSVGPARLDRRRGARRAGRAGSRSAPAGGSERPGEDGPHARVEGEPEQLERAVALDAARRGPPAGGRAAPDEPARGSASVAASTASARRRRAPRDEPRPARGRARGRTPRSPGRSPGPRRGHARAGGRGSPRCGMPAGSASAPSRRQWPATRPTSAADVVAAPWSMAKNARGSLTRLCYPGSPGRRSAVRSRRATALRRPSRSRPRAPRGAR